VRSTLEQCPHVRHVYVDFTEKTAIVTGTKELISQDLIEALEKTKYRGIILP
jgi:hypothetical protein